MKFKIILILFLSLGLVSCYKDAYRSNNINVPNKVCFQATKLQGCPEETFYINENGSKTITILEIDEQGRFINENQADSILNYIKQKSEEKPKHRPIIMTYIHGWNHNALEVDENWYIGGLPFKETTENDSFFKGDLRRFGRTIHNLYASQNSVINARISKNIGLQDDSVKVDQQRDIIGIYISWKGKLYPKPLNYATFWNRKAVSEEIGRGDLQRFLLQLETIAKPNKVDNSENSILISIGHSFGGSALYNAISPILLSRFFQSVEDQRSASNKKNSKTTTNDKIPLRGYGDIVVLINPAIEATRFVSLREAVWRERLKNPQLFDNNTKPLFVSIGGSGDTATRRAFKAGRSIHTFFTENYRNTHLIDGNGSAKTGSEYIEDEKNLDITAIGNYSPFYTHWIAQTRDYTNFNESDHKSISKTSLLDLSPAACEFSIESIPLTAYANMTYDSTTPLLIADHFVSRYSIPNKYADWPRNEPIKTTNANSTTWKNNPYWFVRASKDMISSHTNIWNRQVGCFILEVLLRNNVAS